MLNNREQLNQFLSSVERKAFRIAQLATSNHDDALELVQEAMMKLVEKYAKRPENEWTPLFYRILNSKINDWYRRQGTRNKWLAWLPSFGSDEDYDPIQQAADHRPSPIEQIERDYHTDQMLAHIQQLSSRQQQAFLLRAWEGLSVEQTAFAMNCSEGSVKTHYSRAVTRLKQQLEELENE